MGFKKKFDKVEQSRFDLLLKLKNIDLQKLNLKPGENKWSILQIIFHIIKTEHIALISVEKNLNNFNVNKQKVSGAGIISLIKYRFLILLLRSPIKMKAPKILSGIPRSYNFEHLINKWETLRKNLKSMLDTFPAINKNKIFFTHPYGVDLTIDQTLNFLHEHLEHHKKQISKILKTTAVEK